MNNKRFFFILLLACCLIASAVAQKRSHEYIQQKRVEYLILNMDLSVMESQNFWPVYNEYYQKKNDLSESYKVKYGDFKKFEGKEEEDYLKSIEGMIKNRISQAELLNVYNEKYLEILSAKKVFHLYRLEEEFNKNLMRQLRKPPPQDQKKRRGGPQ